MPCTVRHLQLAHGHMEQVKAVAALRKRVEVLETAAMAVMLGMHGRAPTERATSRGQAARKRQMDDDCSTFMSKLLPAYDSIWHDGLGEVRVQLMCCSACALCPVDPCKGCCARSARRARASSTRHTACGGR